RWPGPLGCTRPVWRSSACCWDRGPQAFWGRTATAGSGLTPRAPGWSCADRRRAMPDLLIGKLLNDIFGGATLDRATAREVLGRLMDGELSQVQAAALLAALRMRGETVDEITGFAEAMRDRAVKIDVRAN